MHSSCADSIGHLTYLNEEMVRKPPPGTAVSQLANPRWPQVPSCHLLTLADGDIMAILHLQKWHTVSIFTACATLM